MVSLMLLMFLLLWLGFLFHRSPGFAGSGLGGLLGVASALLMLVPLAYSLCKRVDWIKSSFASRLSLAKLLSWHIYASLFGSMLGILHSGHRFDSWLGLLLTTSMLLSVLSGFICRYYFQYASNEQKEHEAKLSALRSRYTELTSARGTGQTLPEADELKLAVEGMADSEFSITKYAILKRQLHLWLSIHICLSVAFYLFLSLHIAAGIQYGLRWFT